MVTIDKITPDPSRVQEYEATIKIKDTTRRCLIQKEQVTLPDGTPIARWRMRELVEEKTGELPGTLLPKIP